MKIAIIIDTWFPFVGGGQINAWEISKRIAKNKNNQIEIITRNLGNDGLKLSKNLTVTKLGTKSDPSDQISKIIFIFKCLNYLLKRNYDIIHAHAFLPGITLFLHSKIKKTPTVFTVHGTSIGSNLNGYFSTLLERIILTKIKYTAEITVSRDFFKFKNVNKIVKYIPNGVNIEKFERINAKKYSLPTLLFVGRFHPQKNLINLIKAVNLVKKKIPKIQLIMVGDGEQKKELVKLVKNLKLSSNVKFFGNKGGSELINIYKSSHVFILPSLYEGQSIAILEALAAKIPVITTRTGDNSYLIKNNIKLHFVKQSSDIKNISEVIVKNMNYRHKIKDENNNYINTLKTFNWNDQALKTQRVYTQTLNQD